MNDKEFFNWYYKDISEIAERTRKDLNNVFYELPRNLILVATIIIVFSSPLVSNVTNISEMNCFSKIFLLAIWILLFFSILFGLIQYYIDYKYYQSHFKECVYLIGEIQKKDRNIKKFKNEYDDYRKNQRSSNLCAFVIQIIFISLGLISFLVFIGILIF